MQEPFNNMTSFRLLLLVFCGLALLPYSVQAGEKYQILLIASPSYESLFFRQDDVGLNDVFDSKWSYNVGIEYNHFLNANFSLTTGLHYQNKGFRNEVQYQISGSNELETGITIAAARYLVAPANMNFYFRIGKKTHILLSTGLMAGYLVNSTVNGKNYSTEEDLGDNGFFELSNGKSNIDLFNDFYLGTNIGLGINRFASSKIVFSILPNYRYQLNRAIPLDASIDRVVLAKLNAFAIDFKIGYYFTRNIRYKVNEL